MKLDDNDCKIMRQRLTDVGGTIRELAGRASVTEVSVFKMLRCGTMRRSTYVAIMSAYGIYIAELEKSVTSLKKKSLQKI